MEYRIAVASTDGKVVNQHFGRAEQFHILLADDKTMDWRFEESRKTSPLCGDGNHDGEELEKAAELLEDCGESSKESCRSGKPGHSNTELVWDCRCVVCGKIGPPARKELEGRAISVFDVEGEIGDALEKIIRYYSRAGRPWFPKA